MLHFIILDCSADFYMVTCCTLVCDKPISVALKCVMQVCIQDDFHTVKFGNSDIGDNVMVADLKCW